MTEFAQLLGLLCRSGVFSGSETALVALSMARVDALVKEGRGGAGALYKLKKDPSRVRTTILIGNNLVNIAASAMATVMATRAFGNAGPGIAVGVLTLVILIFGEITPKSLATRYSERISLFIALPMLGFMRLIYPLVWLFGHLTTWVYHMTGGQGDPTVTESEVISLLDYGEQEGTIEHDERKIIERVFAFNDLKARDLVYQEGENLLQELRSGTPFGEIANKLDTALIDSGLINRNSDKEDRAIIQEAFLMQEPVNEMLSLTGLVMENGDYVILSLEEIQDGVMSELPEVERKQVISEVSSLQGRSVVDAVINALKNNATIIIPNEKDQDGQP